MHGLHVDLFVKLWFLHSASAASYIRSPLNKLGVWYYVSRGKCAMMNQLHWASLRRNKKYTKRMHKHLHTQALLWTHNQYRLARIKYFATTAPLMRNKNISLSLLETFSSWTLSDTNFHANITLFNENLAHGQRIWHARFQYDRIFFASSQWSEHTMWCGRPVEEQDDATRVAP